MNNENSEKLGTTSHPSILVLLLALASSSELVEMNVTRDDSFAQACLAPLIPFLTAFWSFGLEGYRQDLIVSTVCPYEVPNVDLQVHYRSIIGRFGTAVGEERAVRAGPPLALCD